MVTLFVGALDQTVVSTALPKIVADLEGFDLLSWLFTAYMLTSTVVIPLVGKLGDLFGRKWFLIGGVLVFMVASGLCGAAPNMESLIGFRFVQGLGGGMIFASVFATLGDAFPPADRGKYIGLFTGTFSLAAILGPTLGGLLTDHGGWRWIFYVNIPISLIALPSIWFNIPSRSAGRKVRIDWGGAVLLAAASVLLLLALVWAGDKYPWDSWQIIALFAGSALGVVLFVVQELYHPEPTLPMHLFKNRTFLLSNLVVFTFGVGVFGAFQYLGIFVQTALHKSATTSGVISTPQSVAVLISSVLGGIVISRFGRYKWQTVFGAFLIALSMVFLRTIDVGTKEWEISVYVIVLGLGFGLVLPTMSLIVQNAVSPQFIGVATSASQFFRQIGSVLGIAIFGAVLANSYNDEFHSRFVEADRQAVGPAIVAQLEDPTIQLNERVFERIQGQIRTLQDGDALLERATAAQAKSVAIAVQLIYTGALVASVISLVLAFGLKEIPLRRGAPAPGGPPRTAPEPTVLVPEGRAVPLDAAEALREA
jgi:EmrB/QacA subfamily drug resistance transporter